MTALEIALQLIDRWLTHQAAFAGLPGFQVAVRRHGKLAFSRAYGYADAVARERYTPRHLGRIASHSKMFTTCLALRLQEQGALRLDEPVARHVPQLAQHRDRRFRKVTLHDLLTNRSGLFRDGLDAAFWELEKPFLSRDAVLAEIMGAGLVYAPGRYTKYSNMGFALAGLALEAATGVDYAALVRREVLTHLGKPSLLPDYDAKARARYAYGHSRKIYDGQWQRFCHGATHGMAPATGFCGNAESATDFLYKLYHTDVLLPAKQRRLLMTAKWPVKNLTAEYYGLGTQFNQAGGALYAGHSGGYPGFSSQTRQAMGSDDIISFITNGSEIVTFNAVRTMAEIIRRCETLFKPAAARAVAISPLMTTKWGCTLYAVGSRQALMLPLNGWLPCDDAVVLTRRADGCYYSDAMQGYGSVGEPVQFVRQGQGIAKVKFGAFSAWPLSGYIKRSKKSLL